MQPQTPQNPSLALAITKAIGYTENGGAPNIEHPSAGKSGEMASIFQYTPDTWKSVAGKYLGDANAPLTADHETVATTARVNDWLEKGYTPEQIFSMWNAGPGEPDAYTGKFSDGSSSTGKNKHNVEYNVPAYVKTGMKNLAEFEPELSNKVATVQGGQSQTSLAPSSAGEKQDDALSSILSQLQSGGMSDGNIQNAPIPVTPPTASRRLQNPLRTKGILSPSV